MAIDMRRYINKVQRDMENNFTKFFNFFYDPDSKYYSLSLEAKHLYCLLVNKNKLSEMSTGFADRDGRFFVHFKRDEAKRFLNIGHQKAVAIYKELSEIGLIEEVKMGCNKVNRTYVLLPDSEEDETDRGMKNEPGKYENHTKEVLKPNLDKDRTYKDRIEKESFTKVKGVPKETLRTEDIIKALFEAKGKTLIEKKIPLAEVQKAFDNTNGTKEVRKKAELKICLAKMTGDWSKVRGRDLAYWYAYQVYPKAYSKNMIGDISKDSRLISKYLPNELAENPEALFYSMNSWPRLYPKYVKNERFKDATLGNMVYMNKTLKEMFQLAMDSGIRFIERGYIETDIRSQQTLLNDAAKQSGSLNDAADVYKF